MSQTYALQTWRGLTHRVGRMPAWAVLLGVAGFAAISQFADPLLPLLLLAPAIALIAVKARVQTLTLLYLAYIPLHISIFKNTDAGAAAGSIGPFSAFGMAKDLLLMCIVGVWLVKLMAGDSSLAWPRSGVSLLLMGYMLWACLHVVNFTSLKLGFWGLRSAMEFSVVALLAAASMRESRDLRAAMWTISLTSIPMIFFGFHQLASGNIMYVIGPEVTTLAGRLTGGFGDMFSTNAYGTYLLVVVLVTYGLLRNAARGPARILLLATLAAAAANLVFTFSRRSWMACLLGMVLYAAFDRRWRIVLGMGIVTLVAAAASHDMITDRLASIFSLTDTSNLGRMKEWSDIFSRTVKSPFHLLWGLGLGLIGPTGMAFKVPGSLNSHNNYILIYGQLGLIGLLMFLAIPAWIVREALWARRRPDSAGTKGMIEIPLVCVAALGFTALFGITFESFPSSLYFWFFLGALLAASDAKVLRAVPRLPKRNTSSAVRASTVFEQHRSELQ